MKVKKLGLESTLISAAVLSTFLAHSSFLQARTYKKGDVVPISVSRACHFYEANDLDGLPIIPMVSAIIDGKSLKDKDLRLLNESFPDCHTEGSKTDERLMLALPYVEIEKLYKKYTKNELNIGKVDNYHLLNLFEDAGLRSHLVLKERHQDIVQRAEWARTSGKDYRALKKMLRSQDKGTNGFPRICENISEIEFTNTRESYNPFRKNGRLVPALSDHQMIILPIKNIVRPSLPFFISSRGEFDFVYCSAEKSTVIAGTAGFIYEFRWSTEENSAEIIYHDGESRTFEFEKNKEAMLSQVNDYRIKPQKAKLTDDDTSF